MKQLAVKREKAQMADHKLEKVKEAAAKVKQEIEQEAVHKKAKSDAKEIVEEGIEVDTESNKAMIKSNTETALRKKVDSGQEAVGDAVKKAQEEAEAPPSQQKRYTDADMARKVNEAAT